jgi:hypothetical protein
MLEKSSYSKRIRNRIQRIYAACALILIYPRPFSSTNSVQEIPRAASVLLEVIGVAQVWTLEQANFALGPCHSSDPMS